MGLDLGIGGKRSEKTQRRERLVKRLGSTLKPRIKIGKEDGNNGKEWPA